MVGYLHCIVPKKDFILLSGTDVLRTYRFNTGQAQHMFCGICGVKSYYHPRSHPDCISINLRCVDQELLDHYNLIEFDGLNWEKCIGPLLVKTQ